MTESAQVIRVKDERCVVRVARKSACSQCNLCAFPKESAHLDVEVENALGAQPGDLVELDMKGDRVLLAGVFVYLIPLLFAGIALGITAALTADVLLQLLFCLIGALIGYIITVVIDRRLRNRCGFSPVMTKIILKGSQKDGKDPSSDGGGV